MADASATWTRAEQNRFEAMKHLFIEGHRTISRMVPRLKDLGLLSCQKCNDPANQRKNVDGVLICETCENTASVFWNRNLERLRSGEAEILQLKWEWIETKLEIIRRCFTMGDTGALKLASQLMDQLAKFGGLDIDLDTGTDEEDLDVQNVPRGLAIKRAPARRHPDPVN